MLRAERVVRNQIFFRRVNEQIRAIADALSDPLDEAAARFEILCECVDGRCLTRVSLSGDEYEAVRRDPVAFAVAAGHEVVSIERVVRRNERFAVVVKFHPEPMQKATDLDPRSADNGAAHAAAPR